MSRLFDAARSLITGSVDAGTQTVGNIHGRVSDYVKNRLPFGEDKEEADNIYDVIRDVTGEIGAFADDMVDLMEVTHASLKKGESEE